MTELVHRKSEPATGGESSSDEVGAELKPNTASIPQGTDHTPRLLSSVVDLLPQRWRNYAVRFVFTFVMIGTFALLVYMGPLWLVLLVLAIQIKCFHEIITIGYTVYRSHELPWFRTLSWYFLVTSNYFLFGENLIDNFRILLSKEELLKPLITYHRFISYCAYCGGIVGFVMSLVKKYYLKQFTLFGWTHMALMIVVVSSHFIIRNIFVGLIWFLVPVSMIICNDIMAYMFGFFLGRTPLIQLSPKKTWEGFIGGAVSTVIFGIVLSQFMVRYDVFVCPLEYDLDSRTLIQECIRNPVFVPVSYELPGTLFFFVPAARRVFSVCPFVFHSVVLAAFASLVGPFGGFFASGFKRAFGIKDFGDLIPGHGGIMDRFDCQILMGVFVWVYYASFIRMASPDKLLTQIFAMPADEQLRLYETLTDALKQNGVLA